MRHRLTEASDNVTNANGQIDVPTRHPLDAPSIAACSPGGADDLTSDRRAALCGLPVNREGTR